MLAFRMGGVGTAVPLASQPLALIRLMPWPLLFVPFQAGLLGHIYLLMSSLLPDAVETFRDQVSPPLCPRLGVRTPQI